MKKTIDISKISSDLTKSSAFFRKSSSPPQRPETLQPSPAPAETPLLQAAPLVATMQPTSQTTSDAPWPPAGQTSHAGTLNLTDQDIEELKAVAHVSQTYRFTDPELALLRDMVYQLNNKLNRGKVAQVDILRIALKLFAKCFTENPEAVVALLKRIK